jgi:hypothetical protein
MEVDLSKQLLLNSWIDAESRVSGGRAGRLFLWIESVDEVLSCHDGSKDSKRKPSTVLQPQNECTSVLSPAQRLLGDFGIKCEVEVSEVEGCKGRRWRSSRGQLLS